MGMGAFSIRGENFSLFRTWMAGSQVVGPVKFLIRKGLRKTEASSEFQHAEIYVSIRMSATFNSDALQH